MHSIYRVKFDGDKLLAHFGGIAGTVVALRSVGVEVKPKTLEKQRERGNIPADMVASMFLASSRIGNPINPYYFLLEMTDDNQPK